jgi:hypothetical protein
MLREQTKEEQLRMLDGKRKALETQIEAMRSEFAREEVRVERMTRQEKQREQDLSREMLEMVSLRAARRGTVTDRNGKMGVEHES